MGSRSPSQSLHPWISLQISFSGLPASGSSGNSTVKKSELHYTNDVYSTTYWSILLCYSNKKKTSARLSRVGASFVLEIRNDYEKDNYNHCTSVFHALTVSFFIHIDLHKPVSGEISVSWL